MQANYTISDWAKLNDTDKLPTSVYVMNYHNQNNIGLYGFSDYYTSEVAETSPNCVAKFTIKPKPCN